MALLGIESASYHYRCYGSHVHHLPLISLSITIKSTEVRILTGINALFCMLDHNATCSWYGEVSGHLYLQGSSGGT